MPLTARAYARATMPNPSAVTAAIAGLFPATQGVHWRHQGAQVIVEAEDWSGVTDAALQAAIDAAPNDTAVGQAQAHIEELSLSEKALFLTFLDVVNQLRRNPVAVLPEITPAQLWTAVKNKAATLT